MLSTSRRILLYWLLLLVPAVVVGLAAIQLLRREEARLRQQGAEVEEARRAALSTQARLIVENIELFAADVQAGLLDAMVAEPVATLDAFMDRWERSNPLVRVGFRCRPDGRLLRPVAGAGGAEGQGFLRRFGQELAQRAPWSMRQQATLSKAKEQDEKRQQTSSSPRQLAVQNINQALSTRRDLQQLASNREYAAKDMAPAPAAAAPGLPSRSGETRSEAKLEGAAVALADTLATTDAAAAAKPGPGLRGWLPRVIDGRLHVLGWVLPEGRSEVIGFELQLAAFISRLEGAMPVELSAGDGLALRDDQGRILHQRGAIPAGREPALRIPLGTAMLPGWEVAAFLAASSADSPGPGFLGVSTLLVAIFVAAILVGGSLLLRQAQRSEAEAAQKTSFVANVSHEFKTPLTTIRLYSELLEQGRVRDQAQQSEFLRTIGRETQRLARLVNNALDFSRLEQGRKKYAREPVELGFELGALLDTHSPRLTEAGLRLQRELPAAPVCVETDRDALGQIVLNLLDNACKYAAAGGEVTVTAMGRAGGGAEVRVRDRGPGVPEAHRERIFEKFHRVDENLTAEKTGAGLGLSIARQLARGLGGELRYAPRDGGGADFILMLS